MVNWDKGNRCERCECRKVSFLKKIALDLWLARCRMSKKICLGTLGAEGVREAGTAMAARYLCVVRDRFCSVRKEQNERSNRLVRVMRRGKVEAMMISSEGMKWLMRLFETSWRSSCSVRRGMRLIAWRSAASSRTVLRFPSIVWWPLPTV